jgi:hypothetical protein
MEGVATAPRPRTAMNYALAIPIMFLVVSGCGGSEGDKAQGMNASPPSAPAGETQRVGFASLRLPADPPTVVKRVQGKERRTLPPQDSGPTPAEPASEENAQQRLQSKLAEAMTISFSGNLQLANRVISTLPDWEFFPTDDELRLFAQTAKAEDAQAPLLVALDRCRPLLPPESVKLLYDHAIRRAATEQLPPPERFVALKVACHATGELLHREVAATPGMEELDDAPERIPPAPSDLEALLLSLSTDQSADLHLRRLSIRYLGALRCSSSVEPLASIAANTSPENSVPLQAAALLALTSIAPERAQSISASLLSTTEDEDLFSAAALALGILRTTEALQILVENAPRCPAGSLAIRTAVRYHGNWITDELSKPLSDGLVLALRALPFCQHHKEDRFKPRLMSLLGQTALQGDPEVIRLVLRNIVVAKLLPSECLEILTTLKNSPFDLKSECPEEHEYIDCLSRSIQVQETTREVR